MKAFSGYITRMVFLCVLVVSFPISADDFKKYTYTKLEEGYQGEIKIEPSAVMINSEITPAYLLELPNYTGDHTIILTSDLKNKSVFYPSVVLLDKKFKVIKKQLPSHIDKLSASRFGFRLELSINPNVRYLAVTTLPALIGRDLSFVDVSTSTVPVYGGNTPIYIPGPTHTRLMGAKFSEEGFISIVAPYKGNSEPRIRHEGGMAGFGVTTGGGVVAVNPDGDNYRAGSGANFEIGYQKRVPSARYTFGRILGGLRMQGGKGNNEGFTIDATMMHMFRLFNVGAGIHFDFNNEVENTTGEKFVFEDSAGPIIYIEKKFGGITFQLNAAEMRFETNKKKRYGGDLVGFRVYLDF